MSLENANDGMRQFARGAITAAVTLNAGAILALLSQTSAVVELGVQYAMAVAIKSWVYGLGFAVAGWMLSFFAAGAYANDYRKIETTMAWLGVLAVIVSFAMMVGGANHLADALIDATIINPK